MNFSYLSRSTLFLLGTFLFILLLLEAFFFGLFLILFTLGYVFLFRKRKSYFREDQLTTCGIIYSPVSGRITQIEESQNGKRIFIKTGLMDEYGIYLPFTSKIEDIFYNPEAYTSRSSSHFSKDLSFGTGMILKDKLFREVKLEFMRFFSGRAPELVVLPGDMGRRQVNIGFFPFGGVTVVNIPHDADLVSAKGEKVIATETILAKLEEEVSK